MLWFRKAFSFLQCLVALFIRPLNPNSAGSAPCLFLRSHATKAKSEAINLRHGSVLIFNLGNNYCDIAEKWLNVNASRPDREVSGGG